MRLNFIVGIDVNEQELASINAKRVQRHQGQLLRPQHNAQEFVELLLLAGLQYDKLLSNATVGLAQPSKLISSGDPDATL